jgi:hypothetical protein
MLARLPSSIPGTSLVGGSQRAADNEDNEQDERDKQEEEQGEQEGRDQHMPPRTKMYACEMHTCEMHACEMHTCA